MERNRKLWGVGLGANIQLSPNWNLYLKPILFKIISQSNTTLGLRWHATDNYSVDVYASTAASIIEA